MPTETTARARQLQPGAPDEADYHAFCTALSESARGRAFLAEYARRNRNADTRPLLSAIERLQISLAADPAAPAEVLIKQKLRALLDDIATEEIGRMFELTLPVYDTRASHAACLTLCNYVDEHRGLWAALLTGGAAGAVREELLRRGREASAARARDGWLPEGLATMLAVSVTIELLTWWLRQAAPLPAAEVAEILDRIAISPAERSPRQRSATSD